MSEAEAAAPVEDATATEPEAPVQHGTQHLEQPPAAAGDDGAKTDAEPEPEPEPDAAADVERPSTEGL